MSNFWNRHALWNASVGEKPGFHRDCDPDASRESGRTPRTHEIGIRMALGAQQQNIRHLVILQGLKLVPAGLVLGMAVSAGLAGVLERLLVYTGPLDPLAYRAATLLLVAVAAIPCNLPARRAMRIDPPHCVATRVNQR